MGKRKASNRDWLPPAVILLLTAVLVYTPHFGYRFPLHADEWHHIGEAERLVGGGYRYSTNVAYEAGYHLLLAPLAMVSDPVLVYRLLPAIYAVAASLALYILVRHLTGSGRAAALSMVFFASLPSDTNLLGLWFATPLTAAIPLIYISLYLLHRGFTVKDRGLLRWYCVAFIFLLLIHPLSAFLVFIVSSLHVAAYWRDEARLRAAAGTLALLPPILFAAAISYMVVAGEGPQRFISRLVFNRWWTPLQPGALMNAYAFDVLRWKVTVSPHFLPVLFGVFPFILALFGLYVSMRHRSLRFLGYWLLYSAATLFTFKLTGYSPLIPNQRITYYSLLALVPLAGIGADRLLGSLKSPKWRLIAVAIIVALTFHGYGSHPPGLGVYHVIGDADYAAMKYLAGQPKGRVVASPEHSTAIYAITPHDVLADMIFMGNQTGRGVGEAFPGLDCGSQLHYIRMYSLGYSYYGQEMYCPGYVQIYSDGAHIYHLGANPS